MKTNQKQLESAPATEQTAKQIAVAILASQPAISSDKANRRAAREKLAADTFTSDVTFLGSLAPIVSDEEKLSSLGIDKAKPATAACVLCGGTHGVKDGVIADDNLLGNTLVFSRQNGDVFFLSNSGSEGCYHRYVRVHRSKILSGEKLPK